MMVFAVRDSAMNAFATPMFIPSLGVAVRSFADEANRRESPINSHPDDYDLYHIGSYDEDTGRLSALDTPLMVARAKDCLVKDK